MSEFTVTIPVKPYVKQYLINNCGDPVDLSNLPDLKLYLRRLLKKPSDRWNSRYTNELKTYNENINIIISEDDFYRYGYELTKTDIIAFSREVELKAKCVMRTMVGILVGLGLPVNKSISRFQERYNFNEDNWSYQTIKKDFYRNGEKEIIDFDYEIFNKIEKLILVNLYNKGTISHKQLLEYDYN